MPSAPSVKNLTEGEGLCPICASEKRDGSVVCVVADPKDVIAMERAQEYHRTYHVLHGVLSPNEWRGARRPYIKSLLDRVAQGRFRRSLWRQIPTRRRGHGHVSVPYAQAVRCKVTRLAYGVPVGGHLEYADDATPYARVGGAAGDVSHF